MTSETRLQEIWRAGGDADSASISQICRQAREFESIIARRNRREIVAGVLVAVVFAAIAAVATQPLIRVGAGGAAASALYVIQYIWRHARDHVPEDDGLPTVLHYRRSLERQRDLLKTVWRWYLGPLGLGLTAWFVAVGVVSGASTLLIAAVVGGEILVGLVFSWLNRLAAASLQRQLDEWTDLPAVGESVDATRTGAEESE